MAEKGYGKHETADRGDDRKGEINARGRQEGRLRPRSAPRGPDLLREVRGTSGGHSRRSRLFGKSSGVTAPAVVVTMELGSEVLVVT